MPLPALATIFTKQAALGAFKWFFTSKLGVSLLLSATIASSSAYGFYKHNKVTSELETQIADLQTERDNYKTKLSKLKDTQRINLALIDALQKEVKINQKIRRDFENQTGIDISEVNKIKKDTSSLKDGSVSEHLRQKTHKYNTLWKKRVQVDSGVEEEEVGFFEGLFGGDRDEE